MADPSPRAQEKGWKRFTDDEGKQICNAKEFNGTLYCPFGPHFVEAMEGYKESFPVKDDDVYLISYPKSGSHWIFEILMMLTRGSADIRDEHKADNMLELGLQMQDMSAMETPRVINTHLCSKDTPPDMLNNKKGKFVQPIRNPADVAVSFFLQLRKEVFGVALQYEWDDYITKLFCTEDMMLHTTWFNYMTKWWPYHAQENFLPVFYEDLVEKPKEVITKIAQFLEVALDDELLEEIIANTKIQKMKAAKHDKELAHIGTMFPDGYSMYRKGVIGDWRNYFTPEQHKQFMACFNEKLEGFPELKEKYSKYLKL